MTDDEFEKAKRWAEVLGNWPALTGARASMLALIDEINRLRTTRDHSCACSINDGSAPLVQHDKDCPIRVNLRKRISPELALQRLGAALDSSDEVEALRVRDDELDSVMSLLNLLRQTHDADSAARVWLERVVADAVSRADNE